MNDKNETSVVASLDQQAQQGALGVASGSAPCPECYGGHFKPCQVCGDTGWIQSAPKQSAALTALLAAGEVRVEGRPFLGKQTRFA